jgi:hypothetical protein
VVTIVSAKPLFSDWTAIGRALVAGLTKCMAKAGVNSPYRPRYQREMRAWLEAAGLSDVESHARVGAVYMAEHEAEIARWREGLTEAVAQARPVDGS